MKQLLLTAWYRGSRTGLSEEEGILEHREVIFMNKVMMVIPVVMAVYLPVELLVNGPQMLPAALAMIVLFMFPLLLNKYRHFRLSRYYMFFIANLFVVNMGLLVGKGINNHVMMIPFVLMGMIIFRSQRDRLLAFLTTLTFYLLQLWLFTFVEPQIIIKPEALKAFTVIFYILSLLTTFLLSYYFLNVNSEYEQIINDQRKSLEHKNKEVTDSIVYAKRIQSAILPSEKSIKNALPQSFVLYNPKDIVAGDFYLVEQTADGVLFAAADCTGHGVPGAMVSLICHSALNKAIHEHRLSDPGKILDVTRELIAEEFSKSENDVKDGMDISLCLLKNNHTLLYAGANNDLWVVRDKQVIEIKADRQPVGAFINSRPFTTHQLELQKNDLVISYTDGYKDQFGGAHGKKLKAAAMKALITSISHLETERQKHELQRFFHQWKGGNEQADDVCVMGVKI